MSGNIKFKIGKLLSRYLSKRIAHYESFSTNDIDFLAQALIPGDVILVEGDTRVSTAIKYLTQSTWSHAAFYAGPSTAVFTDDGEACPLVEAELAHGVIASPLSKYRQLNIRICRPVELSDEDRQKLVDMMVASLGKQYDLKHIFDLARYLFPLVPVPTRLRRRMLALGSGEPTRAICSSLIAESFQAISYPILPLLERKTVVSAYHYSVKEIYHIRHYSLFTPRDFDVSPFFQIIKPTLLQGFSYKDVTLVNSHQDAAQNQVT